MRHDCISDDKKNEGPKGVLANSKFLVPDKCRNLFTCLFLFSIGKISIIVVECLSH